MAEPLALRDFFPPIEGWDSQVPSDLDWHTLEGISIRPVYCKSERRWPHAFSHNGGLVRRDVQLSGASKAIEDGATALGLSELPDGNALKDELAGVPLEKVSLFLEGALASAAGVERLMACAKRLGVLPCDLHGAVAIDAKRPLADLTAGIQAARGTHLKTIHVDLVPWHQAGATHVHELAFAIGLMADTFARLDGRDVAHRLYFTVPVGPRYLIEIARLRALRHLTMQVLAAFGIVDAPVFVQGVMSERYSNALDPDTHLARLSLQHAAAAVGGCDVIHVGKNRLELNMQLILQHEAKLNQSVDAAAGSWYIEVLTEKLGANAWALFQELDERGGFLKAQAFAEELVLAADSERRRLIGCGELPFVGVNKFPDPSAWPLYDSDAGRLASPFTALRSRVSARGRRPVAYVLPCAQESVHTWVLRVLTCGGFELADTMDASVDVVLAFSQAQATSVDGLVVILVGEKILPAKSSEWPLLRAGQDMTAAATSILDLIDVHPA